MMGWWNFSVNTWSAPRDSIFPLGSFSKLTPATPQPPGVRPPTLSESPDRPQLFDGDRSQARHEDLAGGHGKNCKPQDRSHPRAVVDGDQGPRLRLDPRPAGPGNPRGSFFESAGEQEALYQRLPAAR